MRVFNPKDDGTWFDAAGVVEKFGVRPDQVVDVLALMGDSVDNIKGVPGIGDKGAKELINKYGTLEKLIEAAPEITQKRYREGLLNHAEDAYASRALATIRLDVPVTFDPDQLRYRGPQRDKCYTLFARLGFRSLTSEFAPTAQDVSSDYQIVADAAGVAALVAEIRAAKRVSLAVIADGSPAVRASLVGLAVSLKEGHGRYLPFAHAGLSETPNLSERDTLAALRDVLEDATVAKIGHDLKYIAIVLSTRGIRPESSRQPIEQVCSRWALILALPQRSEDEHLRRVAGRTDGLAALDAHQLRGQMPADLGQIEQRGGRAARLAQHGGEVVGLADPGDRLGLVHDACTCRLLHHTRTVSPVTSTP